MSSLYALARPLLFRLDAERAHEWVLAGLSAAQRCGIAGRLAPRPGPLPVEAFGLRFANPVGLAAGLDKDGAHVDALAALGFGFLEVGTTTPRPQPGNPRPRLFRLARHDAIINRLGFNNRGVEVLLRNVERVRFDGVLGINIGKNRDTPNERAIDDYRHCLERVYARASYVTVNVSSPNTAGLRDLQQAERLRRLAGELVEAAQRLGARHRKRTPLLLKIAPDLDEAALDDIAAVLLSSGIDGAICTNTTVDRTGVSAHRHGAEPGGLSGRPLFPKSTAVLRALAQRLEGRLPLVGVGGILDGADAAAKIDAGACLVQCYTGLVFRGPGLVRDAIEAIRARIAAPRA